MKLGKAAKNYVLTILGMIVVYLSAVVALIMMRDSLAHSDMVMTIMDIAFLASIMIASMFFIRNPNKDVKGVYHETR